MKNRNSDLQASSSNPYSELIELTTGGLIIASVIYGFFSALLLIGFLGNYKDVIERLRFYSTLILFVLVEVFAVVDHYTRTLKIKAAKEASDKVADAISAMVNDGQNVANISVDTVVKSLKNVKVDEEQVARLVEQRKQRLLVDDEYFREEVSSLIVEYLQPLPRNAKRLLNKFRVSLLIAHGRGLLNTDPGVSGKQIGKWLVLTERWPQLARTLSSNPETMKDLERKSIESERRNLENVPPDPFTESIGRLAPPYKGDEDLRKFIRSAPVLGEVMPYLVHYSGSQPAFGLQTDEGPVA